MNHQNYRHLLLAGVVAAMTWKVSAEVATPRMAFYPDQTWPDNNGVHINAHSAGILFHEGTYYWFGEHKIAGKAGNVAHVGVHCYTSTDLYNWKDAGIALAVSEDPKSEITKGCIIERPKVIYNEPTKKFVMWFHLEIKGKGYSTASSGVAVADNPVGPYTYIRSVRPNAGVWPMNATEEQKAGHQAANDPKKANPSTGPDGGKTKQNPFSRDFAVGQMARDMTLFKDDDGKAYHIFSSEENSTLHISELSGDYQSHGGKWVRVFEQRFHEAPAICKHAGRYWMITSGCSGWAPNTARSMVADCIWGPWKELGNPCIGTNPHNNLGPEKTFGGQSTFILPVNGKPGAFIALFDIWRPKDAITGGYVWLPITFEADRFTITWHDTWDLSIFGK